MTGRHGEINKFCSLRNLKNESDVEQFFLMPLLADLGYTSDYVQTKAGIAKGFIGKGKRRKEYFPDYIVHTVQSKDKPVLIIDAKNPDEPTSDGVDDAQLYASVLSWTLYIQAA